MSMKRREFLAATGSVLLFGCGGKTENAPSTQPTGSTDAILVIGAGIAGLAAARKLRDAGKNVIVLEARDRIGGRIESSSKWGSAKIDLGASWIHGNGPDNPITQLAQQINARMMTTSYSNDQTFDADGSLLGAQSVDQIDALHTALQSALTQAQSSSADASVHDAAYAGLNYTGRSPKDQRCIDFLINSTIEQEYGGAASNLSTFWYNSDKKYSGTGAVFLDGYQVLIDALAAGLDIRLGSVVSAIAYDAHGVTASTSKGTVTGKCAIITLPLGVLQANAVRFSPALPGAKQAAIDHLGMGVLNKCYLRFPKAFWDTSLDWISYIPESTKAGQWTQWLSMQRTSGQPILLGLNAAAFGAEIEGWSDATIVASAMHTLRTMFGSAIPDPADWIITRWNADPYARGGYSYNKLGSTPAMRTDLAARVDNLLLFAGEATDLDAFQTVHGAYQSGIRAAAEVLTA